MFDQIKIIPVVVNIHPYAIIMCRDLFDSVQNIVLHRFSTAFDISGWIVILAYSRYYFIAVVDFP